MKIFISGPTDNTPTSSLKRFDEIKAYLESCGHEVLAEIDVPYSALEDNLDKITDLYQAEPDIMIWLIMTIKKILCLIQCDALFLLSGWDKCHTSVIIAVFASKLRIPVGIDDKSIVNFADEEEIKNWFNKQID